MSAPAPRRRRVLLVGVSGPDGAGKSGLVAGLRESLAADGAIVATAYLYGCVVCRRMPREVADLSLRARAAGRRRQALRKIARSFRGVHRLIDLAELAVRLSVATGVLSLGRLRHGRPAVLVTDRSPLDGLAKYLPPPASFAGRAYRRLGTRYDAIFLLTASPGVLAARDRDHDEADLAGRSARFDVASLGLPRVVCVDTADRSPADVLALARSELEPLLEPLLEPPRRS